MSNLTAAEKKLSAARTKLVLDKPFIGALVLRLPLVKANPSWCDTTATDAKKFYYNENYIDALSVHQVQFVLGHEALHCALSHFSRRHHRNKRRWDVACDYAINPMLIQDGLTPPPGALHSYNFENMTADEIYPCIDENTSDAPMDQHIYEQSDSEQSSPPPPKTVSLPSPASTLSFSSSQVIVSLPGVSGLSQAARTGIGIPEVSNIRPKTVSKLKAARTTYNFRFVFIISPIELHRLDRIKTGVSFQINLLSCA